MSDKREHAKSRQGSSSSLDTVLTVLEDTDSENTGTREENPDLEAAGGACGGGGGAAAASASGGGGGGAAAAAAGSSSDLTFHDLSPLESLLNRPSSDIGSTTSRTRHSSSSGGDAHELSVIAQSLDQCSYDSGKLFVFQKYFEEPKMKFWTKPENRRRHNAERQTNKPPVERSQETPLSTPQPTRDFPFGDSLTSREHRGQRHVSATEIFLEAEQLGEVLPTDELQENPDNDSIANGRGDTPDSNKRIPSSGEFSFSSLSRCKDSDFSPNETKKSPFLSNSARASSRSISFPIRRATVARSSFVSNPETSSVEQADGCARVQKTRRVSEGSGNDRRFPSGGAVIKTAEELQFCRPEAVQYSTSLESSVELEQYLVGEREALENVSSNNIGSSNGRISPDRSVESTACRNYQRYSAPLPQRIPVTCPKKSKSDGELSKKE